MKLKTRKDLKIENCQKNLFSVKFFPSSFEDFSINTFLDDHFFLGPDGRCFLQPGP